MDVDCPGVSWPPGRRPSARLLPEPRFAASLAPARWAASWPRGIIRVAVTRETPLNRAGIKLAELGIGDTFGEEALISDAKRNASVTMLTEGALMRLAKQDFRTLLNEPMLEWVDLDEARTLVAGGAKWLDVRLPSEFDNYRMEGALNLPLYFMRLKLKTLERDVHYVVCCDTGRRSSAGAYILSERGFRASVLKGGLMAYQDK